MGFKGVNDATSRVNYFAYSSLAGGLYQTTHASKVTEIVNQVRQEMNLQALDGFDPKAASEITKRLEQAGIPLYRSFTGVFTGAEVRDAEFDKKKISSLYLGFVDRDPKAGTEQNVVIRVSLDSPMARSIVSAITQDAVAPGKTLELSFYPKKDKLPDGKIRYAHTAVVQVEEGGKFNFLPTPGFTQEDAAKFAQKNGLPTWEKLDGDAARALRQVARREMLRHAVEEKYHQGLDLRSAALPHADADDARPNAAALEGGDEKQVQDTDPSFDDEIPF